MREILYRGKRKDNGEWVYGYYCKCGWTGKEKDVIIPSHASALYGIDVIPETVGQYIGLKDKNGNKIFEGDIIKCQIEYNCGGYPHSKTSYWEVIMPDIYRVNIDGKIEIIGNKHDNPELSKQKNIDRIYADFNKKAEV